MKTVTIPTCANPFVVIVNGIEYTYPAGATVEVPDDVAAVIEQHDEAHSKHAPAPVVPPFAFVPSTGGGGGGLPVVEIETIPNGGVGNTTPLSEADAAKMEDALTGNPYILTAVTLNNYVQLIPMARTDFDFGEENPVPFYVGTFLLRPIMIAKLDGAWSIGFGSYDA